MDKYVCSVCGYIYDPAQGDPDNGVKPGTPDSKTCPMTGYVLSVGHQKTSLKRSKYRTRRNK